jgi:hypothetical protein
MHPTTYGAIARRIAARYPNLDVHVGRTDRGALGTAEQIVYRGTLPDLLAAGVLVDLEPDAPAGAPDRERYAVAGAEYGIVGHFVALPSGWWSVCAALPDVDRRADKWLATKTAARTFERIWRRVTRERRARAAVRPKRRTPSSGRE